MSVLLRFMVVDKSSKVPCVNRITVLEFTDAPGLPQSVVDDAGNTYTLSSRQDEDGKKRIDTWYTTTSHMPNRITLNYPNSTDGFFIPRDLPRKGPTRT